MELTDKQKAEMSHKAMQDFASSFGPNDLCKEAMFDVLLEIIYDYDGDDLYLPSPTGQENDKLDNDSGKRKMPTYEIE